ncbi:CYtochrome P450 family [Caenorhabditis elegans]|uniref:CYtochrome P450 family n=1 Tax=Caenorhabditis elegans TaxID=6239 RepID=O02627_CAEEL|nr:CYtochrome P450 family [Caenorhabditis elegans]CCD62704.2 CYtochrome P450 family [Caenorhabditis elegans]|eukprot:NP_001343612.1 CYtochrome P450 family [Caenorhabditis elegans]
MFLVLIFLALSCWLIIRQYQKVSRLPPGPVSFPIIGNLPHIIYYLWATGGIVSTLDLFRKKYGNIFTLWVGPVPHVSICDYETSHEVFVKGANKYADIAHAPLFRELRQEMGVLVTNGSHWSTMKRFALHTFRDMGVGKDLMETRIMEELDARCADTDKSATDGVTVAQAGDFFDLTVGSIINSILVGKRFEEHNKDDFLKIKEAMGAAFEVFSPFDMAVPVWFLRTFFRSRYDMMMTTQNTAKRFAAAEAVKRIEDIKSGAYEIDESNIEDYTDAFLLKIQKDGEDLDFNIETLKTMIIDLWMTGQETTTTTLISGFTQLLLHPEVMVKAREEILKITENGSRHLSLTDRTSTPYLNAMIGEIQRHASILNVSFWKINKELTYMGGHPVDAGALVTAQLSALHVNDTIFKNPQEFDPERFIRDEELLQKVIPFGVGKRSCIGESLARAELYLIIGNLLLRYKFEPHGTLSTTELLPYSAGKRPFKLEMKFVKI